MKLDRISPTDLRLTMTAEELAAWIAAARCVLEPGCSELTPASHLIVEHIVADHDEQVTAPISLYPGSRPAALRIDLPAGDEVGALYDPF
jgi:hypothetical protein